MRAAAALPWPATGLQLNTARCRAQRHHPPLSDQVVKLVGGREAAQALRQLRVELGIRLAHLFVVHLHVPAQPCCVPGACCECAGWPRSDWKGHSYAWQQALANSSEQPQQRLLWDAHT